MTKRDHTLEGQGRFGRSGRTEVGLVPRFHSAEEHAAWIVAEALIEQARAMMRQAESALETWRVGKALTLQQCARKGISQTDAEIRWAETVNARNALSDNSFHVSLATMYYGAAAAEYSRAHYLHTRYGTRI